jgi:carbamoyl-phosphate synthase large subunit
VIYDAIALGIPLSRIHDITKIDMVLETIRRALYPRKEISTYKVETLPKELF